MKTVKSLVLPAAAALGFLAAALPLSANCQPDPASASPVTPAAPAPSMGPTLVVPGDAPPAQVDALAQGDNRMLTNGPIADTAANRAKFGKPLSRAGRKTAPTGN
jgi:hypothetical protein